MMNLQIGAMEVAGNNCRNGEIADWSHEITGKAAEIVILQNGAMDVARNKLPK